MRVVPPKRGKQQMPGIACELHLAPSGSDILFLDVRPGGTIFRVHVLKRLLRR